MDHQTSDDTSAPPAAAYPRWILLEYHGGCDEPDARTVAHARTSTGRPISVSFVLAAPPAASCLRLDSPGLLDRKSISSYVIAAHRDSVLIQVDTRSNGGSFDYFLYCAGDAAADPSRPPSLSLLPPCYLTEQEEGKPKRERYLDASAAALLRHGQDEVLVVALAALNSYSRAREESRPVEAELCVLRSGDWEWKLKRLPVIHDEGKRQEVSCWVTDRVISVGDRFVLWVDYFRGIMYSDLWHEMPEMRYVSLPLQPDPRKEFPNYHKRTWSSHRSVCATNGAVRFVDVFPRCCCGCPGATACAVSRYAFTITTWALRMDDMRTWDKVGVVDSDELWSLPGYHGVVPRIKPQYPVVSLDDPGILCFMVHKNKYNMNDVDGDLTIRLIELDTRRMELRSIHHYERGSSFFSHFVASAVSRYFSGNRTRARRKEDTHLEAPTRPLKPLPRVASPEEMLVTLREIPDLTRDDMLKAYGVLAWDESRSRFRSLLALPMDMRKDYCLLIGKVWSCFDVEGL